VGGRSLLGHDVTRRIIGEHALALGCFAAVAVLELGLPVLRHPGTDIVGIGGDQEIFVWALGWWPHALAAGVDPVITHAIWAPTGVNLAWATAVPAAALALAPVTLAAGPVVAYNAVSVAAPALAAFTAYLLCRRLAGGRLWPAVVGGYVCGFSSYELGQSLGHLHMTLVFLVPVVALLVVRAVVGELGARGLVLWLAPVLAVQLGFSTELAASITLALVGGLAIAWWQMPARRAAIHAMWKPLLIAYAGAALLAAPLTWYLVTGFQTGSVNSPSFFSADALNVLVPTRISELGAVVHWPLGDLRGNLTEDGAFLGPLLVLVAVLWARRAWGTRGGRVLSLMLVATVVASFGPLLRVAGHPILPLPWALVVRLPVFDNLLPVRFALFTALVLAVIVARWLAEPRAGAGRWLLAGAALLCLVPSVGSSIWHATPPRPAFFQHGAWRPVLGSHPRILVIPFAGRGHSMLWQADAGYGFDQTGGYVRSTPPAFAHDPFVQALLAGAPGPNAAADLRRFVDERGVQAVVVDKSAGERWAPTLATLGVAPLRTGGVAVYRLARR
jgi:hypothetical protein